MFLYNLSFNEEKYAMYNITNVGFWNRDIIGNY